MTGTSYDIDSRVKAILQEGLSVYRIDAEKLEALRPDIIVTQDHCEVCAASLKDVEAALCAWGGRKVEIVSLKPDGLADIWEDIAKVARALGRERQGGSLIEQLKARMASIAEQTGAARTRPWVAQQLGRPVIKAFNNIYAKHLLELGRPKGTPGRIALPVSGDDDAAKGIVLKLIDELGFDAVDAGGLDKSWRQQPGTPVYTEDFDADGVRRALAKATKIGPQNGAPPTIAPVASPRPREAY